MFNDPPEFTGPEGSDIPIGTLGERYQASGEFDGWGYVNLHDATDPDLPIIDTYIIPEANNEAFATGFGDLTVHEVKTDPRRGINLAYFSYYAGGFRVAEFGANGIREVGRFIDEGGNNFWGVFPIGDELCGHGYPGCHPGIGQGQRPALLARQTTAGTIGGPSWNFSQRDGEREMPPRQAGPQGQQAQASQEARCSRRPAA